MFSVLIIVKGRADHLRNVLSGIEHSSLQPAEVIVVHMNETASEIDSALRIRQYELNDEHRLPLAKARNMAAQHASTDMLIFLDVDCIPGAQCFKQLLSDLQAAKLCMANPLYLKQPVESVDDDWLVSKAKVNPARASLEFGESDRYELFWSLGFAIRKADFVAVGGFDESFIGYGGEDTDFAFSARQVGLSLMYSEAKVYHQNHPSYDPPLNWLEDIVINARRFKQKWQVWPMEGWLRAFKASGYIAWDAERLELLSIPTESDIAAARRRDAV